MPDYSMVKTSRTALGAFLVAMLLPVVFGAGLYGYARYYRSIAHTHDCYPVETCRWDLDGDGVLEQLILSREPSLDDPLHTRLRVVVSSRAQNDEALNIEYVHIDNSLRTHVALLVDGHEKYVVIYDTVNEQQFYHWDGKRLTPNLSPSSNQIKVRRAMELQDDTGGHHTQILVGLGFVAMSIVYYFLLMLWIAWTVFSRRTKLP